MRMLNSPPVSADEQHVSTLTSTSLQDQRFAARAAPAERRRSARHGYIIEAWLGPSSDPSRREEVVTLNLSKDGVAFQLTKPVELGSCNVLEISLGEQKLVTRVQIKRCQPIDGSFWDVGAEFC